MFVLQTVLGGLAAVSSVLIALLDYKYPDKRTNLFKYLRFTAIAILVFLVPSTVVHSIWVEISSSNERKRNEEISKTLINRFPNFQLSGQAVIELVRFDKQLQVFSPIPEPHSIRRPSNARLAALQELKDSGLILCTLEPRYYLDLAKELPFGINEDDEYGYIMDLNADLLKQYNPRLPTRDQLIKHFCMLIKPGEVRRKGVINDIIFSIDNKTEISKKG